MSFQKTMLAFIGAILSFDPNNEELEDYLKTHEIDWDNFVKVGSSHLVLPALYYRLQEKSLSSYLPKDLRIYLEEIATINRNRNSGILKEISLITKLFNKHNINHVFLKGTALLAGNYYADLGERMIGDIDVLVVPEQVQLAFDLIKNEGYKSSETSFGHHFFGHSHRHLPRLVKDSAMCAIEIHKKVLVKPYIQYLDSSDILKDKRIVNEFTIPSKHHLFEHIILNLQINDQGNYYKFVNFRTAFDSVSILNKHPEIEIQQKYTTTAFTNYFMLHALFFNDFNWSSTSVWSQLKVAFFKFKTRHHWFLTSWNKLLFFIYYFPFLLHRSWYFITKKGYRTGLIKDRNRVFKEVKEKLFK